MPGAVPGDITLDKASFIGLVLETLGYGVLTVLFILSQWLLFRKNALRESGTKILMTTSVVLWVMTTIHWIIVVARANVAFVEKQDVIHGALAYYGDLTQKLYTAKTAVYVVLTFFGDLFVSYRVWVVWNKTFGMAVFPLILVFTTAVIGFIATHKFSQLTPENEIFLPTLVPWVTTFIIMTLATNLTCTLLITFRLVQNANRLNRMSAAGAVRSRITGALVVIIESASVYSAGLICLVAVYLVGSNGQYAILDLSATIVGITFHFIILRALFARDLSHVYSSGPGNTALSIPLENRTKGLTVNVSSVVETSDQPYGYGSSKQIRHSTSFLPSDSP
ncbi:hypothetical protein V5O48_003824 [Marasmius crinis-equi]|uniref:Uncharacterized protein n=1 Tax=Marasmius crinis-equi TaxID=585013 RepID=A0ABR3FRT9_9AGAR